MEIKYNVTGSDRKRLVQAIAQVLESDVKYLGVPSCAYQVDNYTISKDGILSFNDHAKVEQLIELLCEMGFEAETKEVTDGLCIELPLKDTTEAAIENLRRMVDSKATLIKMALGSDSLEIEVTEERIRFPWFDRIPDPEVISAASHFLGHLLVAAKSHKRVTAKEKETDNEKYAFRCFLLRLGFIGDEFKETRRTLLRNLTGSAAFRTGAKKDFSAEDLYAASDDPAVNALPNENEVANDEISE
ncbi:virulence protein [Dehalobacter sp.]|uniref:virulence protein n=1 Tax=Dehalobacter sp. TaxID=1962289 RepID=UPI0025828E69|nr:virulence protein [Dehalobacter sp.]MCG1024533.1 virulence protein [Dehalobacter sp.]